MNSICLLCFSGMLCICFFTDDLSSSYNYYYFFSLAKLPVLCAE